MKLSRRVVRVRCSSGASYFRAWFHSLSRPSSGPSIIVGGPGVGKSCLTRALLSRLHSEGPGYRAGRRALLVVDPAGAIAPAGSVRCRREAEALEAVRAGHPVVLPAGLAYSIAGRYGACTLAVDEADGQGWGRGRRFWRECELLASKGRPFGVSAVLISQYPAALDEAVSYCAGAALVGLLPGEGPRRWARELWGLAVPSVPFYFLCATGGGGCFGLSVSLSR